MDSTAADVGRFREVNDLVKNDNVCQSIVLENLETIIRCIRRIFFIRLENDTFIKYNCYTHIKLYNILKIFIKFLQMIFIVLFSKE